MRIEIRSDSIVLDGYVNAVDRPSRPMNSPRGKFVEVITPKTFQKALLKAKDVYLLFNHEKTKVLGSVKGGQLELREDNIGLRAIATVTDETVIDAARQGKLRGWSFAFHSVKDRWVEDENGLQKRFVEDLDLVEVSILSKQPAYVGTSIEMRGEEEIMSETRSEEFDAIITDQAKESKTEEREIIDYSTFENEISILKLKGCSK